MSCMPGVWSRGCCAIALCKGLGGCIGPLDACVFVSAYPVELLIWRSILFEHGSKWGGGVFLAVLYGGGIHFGDVDLRYGFFVPTCELVSAMSAVCVSPGH